MDEPQMNRKEFLTNVGKYCLCSCVCAMGGVLGSVRADEPNQPAEEQVPPEKKPRSQERIEFAEKWVVRFFGVLDANLDEATRAKVMRANGRRCYIDWITETNQQIRPITLDQMKRWIDENVKDGSISYDGNVIYYQYMGAAETGLLSEEHHCLCPLVETNPAGLSSTYCQCSVGYVKEQHDRLFGKPVEVELLAAVLRGDPRCKFKITVS
ncbi:MAG: DUF6144 family protein [candidate division Zixibacteria bacterium]|nr:DUF6144 family protein [candidate division Zixibacteria bacterium]